MSVEQVLLLNGLPHGILSFWHEPLQLCDEYHTILHHELLLLLVGDVKAKEETPNSSLFVQMLGYAPSMMQQCF